MSNDGGMCNHLPKAKPSRPPRSSVPAEPSDVLLILNQRLFPTEPQADLCKLSIVFI